MANKINRVAEKNVVETLKEIRLNADIQCGGDEIEFPDGSKEKFYYNGEADKQAAIKFATICVNATTDTPKAKRMMYTCFMLMTKNIVPERVIVLEDGTELYLDPKKKGLYTSCGYEYVVLTDEEKKVKMSVEALAMLLKEKAERKIAEETVYNYDDNCDYNDCCGDCSECWNDDCDERED